MGSRDDWSRATVRDRPRPDEFAMADRRADEAFAEIGDSMWK